MFRAFLARLGLTGSCCCFRGLDFLFFLHHPVIFRVGNYRVIQHKIPMVMPVQFPAQPGYPFDDFRVIDAIHKQPPSN